MLEGIFDDDDMPMSDEERKAVAEGLKKIIDSGKYDFERRFHRRFADDKLIEITREHQKKMATYRDKKGTLTYSVGRALMYCANYGECDDKTVDKLVPRIDKIIKHIASVELLRKEIEANTDANIAIAVNIVENYRTTLIAFASRFATVLPMAYSFIQEHPPPASGAAA